LLFFRYHLKSNNEQETLLGTSVLVHFHNYKMEEKSELLILNLEDEEIFQKLYSEGLKYSKQCSLEESMPVPKFYTKVGTFFNQSSMFY
jgi:hypothetical protein